MKYAITSDVHLGDPHCRTESFRQFLERLRPEVILVLAGDVVDDPLIPVKEDDLEAMKAILQRQTVIWVRGNHDEGLGLDDSLEMVEEFAIGDRLFVCHGDRFDNVMPVNRWFLKVFGWFHRLRIRLGAHPVHVAQFAKHFGFLYAFLRKNVMMNAVGHACEKGFANVACGHVHYAEHKVESGVGYYNLGAWTETPNHCLLVDDDSMDLLPIDEAMKRSDWFDLK